jgi:hypothetical protein
LKTEVFPLKFYGNGGYYQPADPDLYALTQEFCKQHLVAQVDIPRLKETWVAAEVDKDGKPQRVIGISGFVYRPDIPLFRSLKKKATKMLHDRMQAYFADNDMRGLPVFVFVSPNETTETKCEAAEESLAAFGSTPADRHVIFVK